MKKLLSAIIIVIASMLMVAPAMAETTTNVGDSIQHKVFVTNGDYLYVTLVNTTSETLSFPGPLATGTNGLMVGLGMADGSPPPILSLEPGQSATFTLLITPEKKWNGVVTIHLSSANNIYDTSIPVRVKK